MTCDLLFTKHCVIDDGNREQDQDHRRFKKLCDIALGIEKN